MNKKDVKKILMKYFYYDGTGYHPTFTEDCLAWTELFKDLFGDEY